MSNLRAQQDSSAAHTDKRLLNVGINSSFSYLKHYPENSATGIYAADNAMFNNATATHSVEAQLYRENSLGYSLEVGFRKHSAAYSYLKRSTIFNGQSSGEFPTSSIFVAPAVMYVKSLGQRWELAGRTGVEIHSNLTEDYTQIYYKDRVFRIKPQDFHSNLIASLEARVLLTEALWLGVFIKGRYGLVPRTEVDYRKKEEPDFQSIGYYTGTGLDMGMRLSYCFSCR